MREKTVMVKLTIRELQMTCAALLRHMDNIPVESAPILRSAHTKTLNALHKAEVR